MIKHLLNSNNSFEYESIVILLENALLIKVKILKQYWKNLGYKIMDLSPYSQDFALLEMYLSIFIKKSANHDKTCK